MNFKRFCKAALITGATVASLTAFASATELKIGVGIIEANGGLRLRASASTDGEVLATAGNGDTAVVIRDAGDWYLVDYNLEVGYMSKEYVQFKAVESVDLGNGRVNCPTVNVRAKPGTESDLVQQLTEGYEVTIIGLNNGWYKITFDDKVGYVRSDLLELTTAPLLNKNRESAKLPEDSMFAAQAETQTGTSDAAPAAPTAAPAPVAAPAPAPVSEGVDLATYAQNFLGVPYVWGGTTTNGFDCSGFTQYVFKQYGYKLYRIADSQMKNGTPVSKDELAPGDLVFFGNTYYSSETATHVGIYIGDNKFVHAASGGVKITKMSDDYYAARYVGARRVIS